MEARNSQLGHDVFPVNNPRERENTEKESFISGILCEPA
jgi:hypothetical protein